MELNKYQVAFDALYDEDEMYKLAKGFSFDDDYTSEYDYEKAKEYCKSTMQGLIDKYAWIPVEERLPEKEGYYISGDYLVTLKYDILNMSVVQCARITPDERWMRMPPNGEIDVTNEVIAWMSLPEAYGGE